MNNLLKRRMEKEGYRFLSIDLFSGPGGLCTGFKWAGILPLIAVEWTDTTVETYSVTHNTDVFELELYFDNSSYIAPFLKESAASLMIHGDINKVSNELILLLLQKRYGINAPFESIDLVSGGAPCESFSMAGTRTANDERDDLFSNILRVSRAVQSKVILFENVKGIFSKPRDGIKGAIFEYICNSFEREDVNPKYSLVSRDPQNILLRACDYGVPQIRERVILIALRNDLNLSFSYPKKEYGPDCKSPYVAVRDAISDLPIVESGEEKSQYSRPTQFISDNQKEFINLIRGDTDNHPAPYHLIDNGLYACDLISVHKGPGHTNKKKKLLSLIPAESSMKTVYQQLNDSGDLDKYRDVFPNTIYGSRNRRLHWDEPSFTVTSHCLDEILHPYLDRAITPREAARLQSFPDWYQFAGPYVEFHGSAAQDKYEQIGDAVPPLLAFAVGKEIVKTLENAKKKNS